MPFSFFTYTVCLGTSFWFFFFFLFSLLFRLFLLSFFLSFFLFVNRFIFFTLCHFFPLLNWWERRLSEWQTTLPWVLGQRILTIRTNKIRIVSKPMIKARLPQPPAFSGIGKRVACAPIKSSSHFLPRLAIFSSFFYVLSCFKSIRNTTKSVIVCILIEVSFCFVYRRQKDMSLYRKYRELSRVQNKKHTKKCIAIIMYHGYPHLSHSENTWQL